MKRATKQIMILVFGIIMASDAGQEENVYED